ncbi:unnamed protein product [Lampetra planeri]
MPKDAPDVQRSNSIIPCFIFVELVIMAGVVMLAYYFEFTDTFTVHVQGFFCFAPELSKPYPGPEERSKIPPVLIYSLTAGLPVLLILVGEVTNHFVDYVNKDHSTRERTILTGDCCYINPLLRRLVRFTGVFAFGYFATDIFVNVGQVVTGSPVPHFLSVCRPNYTALGCGAGAVAGGGGAGAGGGAVAMAAVVAVGGGNGGVGVATARFVAGAEDGACTGDGPLVQQARRSFPSKDAALAMYAALYVTMYVTSTVRARSTRLAKPVLCLAVLCLACVAGVNRVTEFRNHWGDVLAGFTVGLGIAFFLGFCVVHNFRRQSVLAAKPRHEAAYGMSLLALPRVESPLDTRNTTQNHATSITEVT